MHISPEQRRRLLITLAQSEGFDTIDNLLEHAAFDSVSPAICVTDGCGYTTDMEPDQGEGWCEACGQNTVQSALILAGMI